jgi:hypothetical protein
MLKAVGRTSRSGPVSLWVSGVHHPRTVVSGLKAPEVRQAAIEMLERWVAPVSRDFPFHEEYRRAAVALDRGWKAVDGLYTKLDSVRYRKRLANNMQVAAYVKNLKDWQVEYAFYAYCALALSCMDQFNDKLILNGIKTSGTETIEEIRKQLDTLIEEIEAQVSTFVEKLGKIRLDVKDSVTAFLQLGSLAPYTVRGAINYIREMAKWCGEVRSWLYRTYVVKNKVVSNFIDAEWNRINVEELKKAEKELATSRSPVLLEVTRDGPSVELD